MNAIRLVLCAAALAVAFPALAQTQAPPAPPQGPIHVVTYVETGPGWVDHASAALRAYRDAAQKEPGAGRVDVYVETTRPNRFVVDETWKDFSAYDTHAKASKLADALKDGHLAPPDIRAHTEWAVGAPAAPVVNAIFAFTHIDVSPPKLARLQEILKPYIEKSRADKGALRFDILQGFPPRSNHQTLAESWATEADFNAHLGSAYAIDFREKIGPLLGALFDQRVYRLVR